MKPVLKMNDEDRRVTRTRRLLKQALVDLTSEQTFETITLRDITDRADIGYATFFRHYDGKDELMLEIFTGIIEELESQGGPDAPNEEELARAERAIQYFRGGERPEFMDRE